MWSRANSPRYPSPMPPPRITIRSNQMGGAPCIRGLRIPVSVVVDMVASGLTVEEVLELYPDLEREDVSEALRFAAEVVREHWRRPVSASGGLWWVS